MGQRANKYAGIKQMPDGSYFARAYHGRKEYSRSFPTQGEAVAWRGRLISDLRDAPNYLEYIRGEWVGHLRAPGGRQLRIASASLHDADAEYKKQQLELEHGLWQDPELKELTLGEFVPDFRIAKKDVRGKSWAGYNSSLRCHLPSLLPLPIREINSRVIRDWLKSLEEAKVGPVAQRQAYRLLRNILSVALIEGKIDANPATGITFSNKRKKKIVPLEVSELKAIADASGKHADMVWFTGMCGMRWGEVTALRIKHVNLLRGKVTVDCAWSTDESGRRVLGPTKSGNSRTFKIPDEFIGMVTERVQNKSPEDLVFPGRFGEPIGYSTFYKSYWKKAVKAANLPKVTFHELRHTCASQLIRIGAPILVVSEIMGHASPKMTLDVYGHLYEGDADRWMDGLGAHMEPVLNAPTEQERNESKSA